MDEGLKIRISADTQQAEAGIKKVTQSLNNLKPGANQATTALTNLSRVAQDAPFGFIGIANNIEPLIGSFVALKKETGSTSGALSALAASLTGGGGLILGVGVLSAAMSVFGGSMFSAGKKSKEAADEIKSANDVIRESTAGTQGDIAKVQALAAVIKDSTKSYELKKRAIEELKDINKSYFGELTAEKTSYEALTKAVNEYTNALVAKAVVAGFEQEISKLSVQLFESQQKLKAAGEEVSKYTKVLDEARKSQAKVGSPGGSITGVASDAFASNVSKAEAALGGANKEFNNQSKATVDLAKRYSELQKGIKDATVELLKFKSLDPAKPTNNNNNDGWDDATARKKFSDLLKRSLSEFNTDIDLLNRDFQKIADTVSEKIGDAFNSGASTGDSLKFKIKENLQKSINKALSLGIELPDLSFLSSDSAKVQVVDDLILQFTTLKEESLAIAQTVTNALEPAFAEFFNTIVEGSGNPFEALGKALQRLIAQLVATIAKAAVLAAIMTAIAPGSAGFGDTFLKFLGNGVGFKFPGTGVANNFNAGGITGAARPGSQQLVTEIRGSSLALILKRNGNSNGI